MAKAGSTLTVAAALLAGSMAAASAADLPVKAPIIAPVVVAYDWSGWYAGVGIGGLWHDSDWRFLNFPFADTFVSPSGEQWMAGVHGGYQWHWKTWPNGGIVLGMEYSASANLSTWNDIGGNTCPGPAFTCRTRIENVFTVGGRLGFTWDKFMIYGAGGWAGSHVNTAAFVIATGLQFDSTRQWHNGWYAGGGIEWVFYQTRGTDWIIGVDFKHIEYDDVVHFVGPQNVIPLGNPFSTRRVDNLTADTVMARLTVKLNGPYWIFGGAAPVVAKY